MNKLKTFTKRLLKNKKGQGMVEYILLLVVVVAVVTMFKTEIMSVVTQKIGDLKSSIGGFQ